MQVEILYFEGCPNSDDAACHVREALANENVVANIRMVEIRDAEEAVERRFLGSPTIHIDGEDVEPVARGRVDYSFMCRTYRTFDGRVAGVPLVSLIAQAIRDRSA